MTLGSCTSIGGRHVGSVLSVITAGLSPPPVEDVLVSVAELQQVGGRGRGRGSCLLAQRQRLQQGTALRPAAGGGGGGGGPQLVVEDVGRRGGGRAGRGHPGNLYGNIDSRACNELLAKLSQTFTDLSNLFSVQ